MFAGQLVFAQLMDFLPRHEFNACVRRYRGDYRSRGFTLSRSVSVHGIRAAHVSRELAGHRNVPAFGAAQAVSCRFSFARFSQHAGGRQPSPRLANLLRLRPGVDCAGRQLYADEAIRRGFGSGRLCSGRDDHRPVLDAVSLGSVSTAQSGRQSCTRCWTCAATFPRLSAFLRGKCTKSTCSTNC